jgi:hypothetical protein
VDDYVQRLTFLRVHQGLLGLLGRFTSGVRP